MPAILIQRSKDKAPMVAVGIVSAHDAEIYLKHAGRTWAVSKIGRSAKRIGSDLHLFYSDGKLNMLVTIDPTPPPGVDEPGQKRRKANA